jgi:hypothetical protein
MGPPFWWEEGLVFLSRFLICCTLIQQECTHTHTASTLLIPCIHLGMNSVSMVVFITPFLGLTLPWKPHADLVKFSYSRIRRWQQWTAVFQSVLQYYNAASFPRGRDRKFAYKLTMKTFNKLIFIDWHNVIRLQRQFKKIIVIFIYCIFHSFY